jgi:hypothetical protein
VRVRASSLLREGSISRRWVAAAVSALALVVATPLTAYAGVSSSPDSTDKVGGTVYALAQAGDLTILGGTFGRVGGKPRSNVAAIGLDGKVDPTFLPATDGKVDALAVSSDGGTVYLGGRFTTVNGVPRANLAAVDAVTGALIDSWQADTVGLKPDVKALTVFGDRLYVGGAFAGIDGTGLKRLVALDSAGNVDRKFAARANRTVTEVKVSPDGSIVYAGGAFTKLGGQVRDHAGSVLAANGSATTFAPEMGAGNVVTIGLSPDGSQFFASTENNTVFAFSPAASNSPSWLVKMSGNTQAMAVSDDEIYIGGHFSQVTTTKQKRPNFASLFTADGSVTDWNPLATGGFMGVWALLINGPHLHAGGVFTHFDGVPQRGYARFTRTP